MSTVHEKSFSDTLAFADAVIKGVGKPVADSLAFADAMTKAIAMSFFDVQAPVNLVNNPGFEI